MTKFSGLGCKAVTITGGGEPLLYPRINELIEWLYDRDILVGLVTNGTKLEKLKTNKLVWIRISMNDSRAIDKNKLEETIKWMPTIDWAFSYVVSEKPNMKNIMDTIRFANYFNFTHVRLVSDLLNLQNITMKKIIKEVILNCIDDNKVIYQRRKEYTRGTKDCLISLLKPVIGADGKIYPCCGVQYAEKNPSLDYGEKMCMGSDIDHIWSTQENFDGSDCVKCYYSAYNNVLTEAKSLSHKEFV